jgi:hypothetical protein
MGVFLSLCVVGLHDSTARAYGNGIADACGLVSFWSYYRTAEINTIANAYPSIHEHIRDPIL